MKIISTLFLVALLALSARGHGGETEGDHGSYDGQESGSSGRDRDNSGRGYDSFTRGNVFGSFQVKADGTVQTFDFVQSSLRFSLSVLLDGNQSSNLTVAPLDQLGDFYARLNAKFPSYNSQGFAKAYDFYFNGNVTVNSLNLTLTFPNTESHLVDLFLPKLNLYFVSASNQYFGQVQQTVTSDAENTYFTFDLLPAKRAVYFFAVANVTGPVPSLFDSERKHKANELVQLAFDAGLQLQFKNKNNCSSVVSFRDTDDHPFPKNYTSLGRFFDVEVTDQNGLEATLSFTINATALAARGVNLNRLKWAVLHENGTWTVEGGTVTGSVLVYNTNHFSSWAVVYGPADSTPATNAKSNNSSSQFVSLFVVVASLIALFF